MCRCVDWIEIKDNDGIDALMEQYAGFHDSCIISISYQSGNYVDERGAMGCGDLDGHTLSMIVQSQWGKPLELLFSGVRKCNITGFRDSYFCDIFEATLEIRTDILGKTRDDRLIVWADRSGFNPLTYTEEYPLNNWYETTYIIAEKLRYRFLADESEDLDNAT